jgi:hypothetical protein
MMQGALLGLVIVAAVTPSATVTNPKIAAKAGREVLRGCGAGEARFMSAPDDDWTPVAGAETKHAALRQSLSEPMPASQLMVSIYAIGGDLATAEFSVILTRDDNGNWNGTAVGQSKVWIEGAKPSIMPRRAWTLSEVQGRKLDALLTDKCFYAEPTTFNGSEVPGVGALFMEVETLTPGHERRFAYKGGRVEGLSKDVTDLTFPPTS